MSIKKQKLKILIITPLILSSTYCYSLNKNANQLSDTEIKEINFSFFDAGKYNLSIESNKHHHGTMNDRFLPKVLTSKYQSRKIISYKDKIEFNYLSGAGGIFSTLEFKDFDNITLLSLSEDGRYLIAHGQYYKDRDKDIIYKDKNKNKNTADLFFVYDTYLKETSLFTNNEFSYTVEDDYYFTTKDGLFSLYSEDMNPEKRYLPINEKIFFIYDIVNKKSIPLNEIDNSPLKNHIEKDKFTAFSNLNFFGKFIALTPNLTSVSHSGKYLYGTLKRENQESNNVKLAFIYDKSSDSINTITTSGYGSSKINAVSKNDIFVGWTESLVKSIGQANSYLIRQAFIYDSSKKEVHIPDIKPPMESNNYYNSEAMDISENGDFFVGWTELKNSTHSTHVTVNQHFKSEYPRSGFIYFINNKELTLLESNYETEAHSISKDGNTIFGVSKKPNNRWVTVAWDIDRMSEEDLNNNENRKAIDIKYDTLLANNDITKIKNFSDSANKKITKLTDEINQAILNQEQEKSKLNAKLNSELNTLQIEKEEARKEKERIEKLIDDGDGTISSEPERYNKYSDKHNLYKKKEEEKIEKIEKKITLLNNSKPEDLLNDNEFNNKLGGNKLKLLDKTLKLTEYEYKKSKATLTLSTLIQKNKQAPEQGKPVVPAMEILQPEQDRLNKVQAEKDKELTSVEDEFKQLTKENNKPSIVISKPIDIENTYKSIQLSAENGYKLIDMQQGQLRYLTSAICSVGNEKACISGFTHYQNLNKSNATQTGISGAYRFDINRVPFVMGLAIDTDVYSSLPKGYQHQGYPLPLIGFSLDLIPSLNKELISNALHLSLKGAYLNRKVSIERQQLEDTEMGKGNAKLSGYHIELQGYYPYSATNELTLTPFVGITFNEVSRSAYSETEGAKFIAHYEKLKEQALSAKLGVNLDYLLTPSLTLNTKAGMFWQLSQQQRDFRSHIKNLGQQHIEYAENKKQLKRRPFANIGLTYQIDKQSSVGASANWEITKYRYHDMQFGVNYTYRF